MQRSMKSTSGPSIGWSWRVGAGIGVTLIPEMAVAVETRSAQVAVNAFPAPEPTRRVGMIWRKTSPLASKLSEIADLIRPS